MRTVPKRRRGPETWIVVGALIFAFGWAGLHALSDWHFRRAIPAGLPIRHMIAHGGDNPLFSGCGVAVFWMTPGDSRRIAREGIAALGPSLEARGYPPRDPRNAYRVPDGSRMDRDRVHHTYKGWRETPIPPEWTEGTWTQMACSGSWRTGEFTRAAESEGSFYATSHAGWILVLPRQHRVLLSYSD